MEQTREELGESENVCQEGRESGPGFALLLT